MKRNPIAKALRSPHLAKRVQRPKKGGGYTRKGRKPPPGADARGALRLTPAARSLTTES